jgi:hypothetical protein
MADGTARSTRSENSLDDIERRLQAFEHATRRLSRAMPEQAKTRTPAPIPTPADPTTGSGRRPVRDLLPAESQPRGEEISGLRPAVAGPPQTGALTARSRAGGQATPGFTSKIGKPAIPLAAAPPVDAGPPPARTGRVQRRRRRTILLALAALPVVGLLALPRLFAPLGGATVWAETRSVAADSSGVVEAVHVRFNDAVAVGAPLARIAGREVVSPADGEVQRLMIANGARLVAGDPIAEIALAGTRRVVAPLPAGVEAAPGARASVRLLGEGRWIDGTVELVVTDGAARGWPGGGALRHAVIHPDPSLTPPDLGQGAQIVLVGSSPGRQLLYALRRLLPW